GAGCPRPDAGLGSDGEPRTGLLLHPMVGGDVPGSGDLVHCAGLQSPRRRGARSTRSPPGDHTMTIEIRGLAIPFDGHRVAYVESLDLPRGQIVGLVGESGSGKSMTATAILGLAERMGASVSGSIRLDGTELVGAAEPELRAVRGRRIAMIFQSPSASFHPLLKVGDLFTRVLRLHRIASRSGARKRAEAAVEEM